MKNYEEALEVEEIAKELIEKYPENFDENITWPKIAYVFNLREKCSYFGQIQLPGGAWEFMLHCNFVMVIHKESWDTFSSNQKQALVFHELKHVAHKNDRDGNVLWRLCKHDIEEFLDVVAIFGDWTESLKELKKILK